VHGGDGGLRFASRQAIETSGDLRIGASAEFLERLSSLIGDNDDLAAKICRVAVGFDQPFGAKTL